MKMTGGDVVRESNVLFLSFVLLLLATQTWAISLTGSTNLTAQSVASGQANCTRLPLQGSSNGVSFESTNAIPRSGNLNILRATPAMRLRSTASMQSMTSSPPSDLIVWWRFDEGSGTSVADASGNGHTATLQGDSPPAWINGVTSGALDFDGYQYYVESDDSFNETISAYTIEAWFAARSASGENPAIISTLGDDIGFDYLGDILIWTNGYFYGNAIALNTRWDVLVASQGLVDGKWHHVAATWDGTNSSLYVDGQLVATQPDAYDGYSWTTPLRLAYRDTNPPGCHFGGSISDVRIYRRALSSDEVAADYNIDTVDNDGITDWWRLRYFGSGTTTNSVSCASCDPNHDGYSNLEEYQNGTNPLLPSGLTVPSDLIVWWSFDEGTGSFAGDVTGNGHCGLLLGDSPPAWTNGVTSGALSFDGSQNYVQTELPFHETISGYTIEAWFAASSGLGENPAIISTLGDDIGFDYLGDILIWTNGMFYGNAIALNTRWDVLVAQDGLFDGNWHHVAGTWDGTNSSLYVDGQLVATQPDEYDGFSWTTPLRLAYRDTNGGCNYGGNIGEVRVYSRALSSNEVAAAYNTDTVGDGIPDWWRFKYFGSGTTVDGNSCGACTSPNPWAHELTNLQVYHNPSVLISNNYTTYNDGIPDWWRVKYFGTAVPTNSLSCASCDADNTFWSNLADYQNGIDPTSTGDALPLSFSINGGTDPITTTQLHLELPTGIVADYVVVSEDLFLTSVTNAFASAFDYTLGSNVDGLHTVYLRLLKSNGRLSTPFAATVQVEAGPPVIWTSSPTNGMVTGQRRVDVQGFAGDANTNASAPLQVAVNGDFVNDRDTNGNWWSAQDLAPGTNTFLAVATGIAGLSSTTSVWLIYDPALATNVPNFTLDVTNTVTVGSNTTAIAVSGTIDDSNATVRILVLDASDNTITNASASAAVKGTNWWANVPVVGGNNAVIVTAQNSNSQPATNGFVTAQNTSVFLVIDSPTPDTAVNGTSVVVVGHASTNFDKTITINGIPAFTSTDANGIVFSNSVPINSTDANIIEVDATGTDGSSATTRETVYAYQLLSLHASYNGWIPIPDVLWGPGVETYDWDPSRGDVFHRRVHFLGGWPGPWEDDMPCNFVCGSPNSADVCVNLATGYGYDEYYYTTYTAEGDFSYGIDAGSWDSQLTVIKHAPNNEEQLVVFHFNSFGYSVRCADPMSFDPSQITFRGAHGFWYIQNGQTNGVAFLVKVRTNIPFTIQAADFRIPSMADNCPPRTYQSGTSRELQFTGFGNALVGGKVQSVAFNGGTHTMYANGDHGGWGVGDPIDNPVWTRDGTRNPVCYSRNTPVSMHVEIKLDPPVPDGLTIPATLVADAGDLQGSAPVNLSGSNVTKDITVGTLSNMVYKATPTFKWKFLINTPSGLGSNEFDQTTHTIYVTYADPISDGGSLTPQRLDKAVSPANGTSNVLTIANAIYSNLYNDKQAGKLRSCLYVGPFARNFAPTGCRPGVGDLPDLTYNWYMYSPVEPGEWDIQGACITFAELHNLELQILGINAGTPVLIAPVPDDQCGDILQDPLADPWIPPTTRYWPCSDGLQHLSYMQYCAGGVANNYEGALKVVDGGTTKYYAGAANIVRSLPSQILQAQNATEYYLWGDNTTVPAGCTLCYCGQSCVAAFGTTAPPNCP